MSETWRPAGGPPPPLAGDLHVWRVDLDAAWEGAAALDEKEIARGARIRSAARRRRWQASRRALRSVLAAYAEGDPAELELAASPGGKPYLRGDGPEFNLSHADGLALIAVSAAPVGVDIERREPRGDIVRLAEHGLGPEAAAAIRAAPEARRPALFYAAWCRHEARAKCGGDGLAGPPPAGPIAITDLDPGPQWAAAVAVRGAERPTLLFEAAPTAPFGAA